MRDAAKVTSKKCPRLQVYLLAALYHHRSVTDDLVALTHLPYAEAIAKTEAVKTSLKEPALKNSALALTAILLSGSSTAPLRNQAKAERPWPCFAQSRPSASTPPRKGASQATSRIASSPSRMIPSLASFSPMKSRQVSSHYGAPRRCRCSGPQAKADREYEIRLRAK